MQQKKTKQKTKKKQGITDQTFTTRKRPTNKKTLCCTLQIRDYRFCFVYLKTFLTFLVLSTAYYAMLPSTAEQTIVKPESTDYVYQEGQGRVICSYCFQPFRQGESGKILGCFHKYHIDCLERQLQEDMNNGRAFKCNVCEFMPKGVLVKLTYSQHAQSSVSQAQPFKPKTQPYQYSSGQGRVLCAYCLRAFQHGESGQMLKCYHKYHHTCMETQLQENVGAGCTFKCAVCNFVPEQSIAMQSQQHRRNVGVSSYMQVQHTYNNQAYAVEVPSYQQQVDSTVVVPQSTHYDCSQHYNCSQNEGE
eukprot:TRINITY_DN2665_c0_g1_i1.p1 TRINITY_DN2665_c0_g1~~TRINITY_DN2665_c0_g1_i1.p1  ORF type:complete len:324 (+),score=1.35 TRINITY_DN2665_c0_g1_i1:61-972(+)